MTTYKNVCKIQRSNLYLTFLFSEFINMVLVAFADTVFVTCANTLSDTFRILWQTTTEYQQDLITSYSHKYMC